MKKKLLFIFMLFLLTASLFAGSAEEDYQILKSFYQTCGTGSSVSWEGITLNSSGRVISIDLTGKGFSGTLPANLGNMDQLIYLYLTSNNFTGSVPAEWEALSNLERLYIDQNQLSGALPAFLGNMTTLKQIFLGNHFSSGNNDFEGTLPPEWGNLINLEKLKVSDMNITGTIPDSWSGMARLRFLDLGRTNLSGSFPAVISGLTTLITLVFQRCDFSGPLPSSLMLLTSLRSLNISANNFSGPFPLAITEMTELRSLWMSGNNFTGEISGEIGNLTKLEKLTINGNAFEGDIPDSVGNLIYLKLFYMDQNQFTDLPESIVTLPSITEVRLGNNRLCNLSDAQKSWGDTYIQSSDANWQETQECSAANNWAFTLGDPDSSIDIEGRSVALTTDGGYITAGQYKSADKYYIMLTKIDEDGIVLWQKNYFSSSYSDGDVYSITPTSDGNFLLTGYYDYGGKYLWLMKVGPDGSHLWSNSIAGYVGDSEVNAVAEDSEGNYIVAGSYRRSIDVDFAVLKIRPDGTHDGPTIHFRGDNNDDTFNRGIVSATNGGFFILNEVHGTTKQLQVLKINDSISTDSIPTDSIESEILLKSNSNLLPNGSCIISTPDNCAVIMACNAGDYTTHIVKVNAACEIVWQKTLKLGYESIKTIGTELLLKSNGNIAGLAVILHDGVVTQSYDNIIFELDQNGNIVELSNKAFGTPYIDGLVSFVEAHDDGYVAVGTIINGSPDLLAVKTNSDGSCPPIDYEINPIETINANLTLQPTTTTEVNDGSWIACYQIATTVTTLNLTPVQLIP